MRFIFFFILLSQTFVACHKADTSVPDVPPVDFSVNNTWQCEVGGITYSGSIDTSFYKIIGAGMQDTILYLSGSSANGKANITMKMFINRTSFRSDTMHITYGISYFRFDTSSNNYLQTSSNATVLFSIEGFTTKKLKGSFSGILNGTDGSYQNITNGKLSLDVDKGNSTPKFLGLTVENKFIYGPIRTGVIKANTLIIDGVTFDGDSVYQLQIRTGTRIKTGVYHSQKGDVGFQLWRPDIVTHYVSDSLGDLAVTILSVTGDIVTGTFKGNALTEDGSGNITPLSGYFTCRVKDYYNIGVDSLNQWGFSIDNRGQYPYETMGGNISNASIFRNGVTNRLIINGHSDYGSSVFHISLTSYSGFSPGAVYSPNVFVDSCYFSNRDKSYFAGISGFYIKIDSINSQRIAADFYGNMTVSNLFYGSGTSEVCRKGYFQANF
ncbi:hypothetical protein FW778_04175 [Ginsengibacter hankyongi]|uniref:Uncharacterized protein n=1 Tax=Ginsengibacter hankyongi TaxID=2607284 RepID=A0A5J5IJL2_9BACT|nr:hypothetical protein [Ginsengibacter hankyongi]KAA9041240.1 hypothetical protein FW778_04175 [Ginsengibacter hankyongi]